MSTKVNERRTMRYSDVELSTIKSFFAEDNGLIQSLRKVFFQVPLGDVERSTITNLFSNKSLLTVVEKTFLPELDVESPLLQNIDLWMTVEVKGKPAELAYPEILARDIVIKYVRAQIDQLAEPKAPSYCVLQDMIGEPSKKDPEKVFVDLMARNTIVTHIDMQLFQLVTLAGKKEETVEQTKERLSKNSSK